MLALPLTEVTDASAPSQSGSQFPKLQALFAPTSSSQCPWIMGWIIFAIANSGDPTMTTGPFAIILQTTFLIISTFRVGTVDTS